MRFAAATFIVAMVLFVGGATSLVGTWGVSAACLLFLVAAISGSIALEDADQAAVEGLLTTRPIDVEPASVGPEAEPTHLEVA